MVLSELRAAGWQIGCVALGVLLAAAGAQLAITHHRLTATKEELATEKLARTADERDRAGAVAKALIDGREQGERLAAELEEQIRAKQPELEAARAAADRVPDLDRRVRDATAAVRVCSRALRADPGAGGGGSAAEEAARVLAELQRASQAAEAARTRFADEAAAAGELCAAGYEAVRKSRATVNQRPDAAPLTR